MNRHHIKAHKTFCVIIMPFLMYACVPETIIDGESDTPITDASSFMTDVFIIKAVSGKAVIVGIKTDPGKTKDRAEIEHAYLVLQKTLSSDGMLVLESAVAGLPLAEIEQRAFYDEDISQSGWGCGRGILPPEIKGIAFPATLEKIGMDAFSLNASLETVVFPKNGNLHSIEKNAFIKTGITSLVLPPSVDSLGLMAFYMAEKLVSVDLGKTKIVTLPGMEFYQCKSLKSVIFPDTLETIGQFSFAWCASLEEVLFPPALKKIKSFAFISSNTLARADFSAVTGNQVVVESNAFKNTGFWGGLAKDDVWTRIPPGHTIDKSGKNSGFFSGVYGNKNDTGWNSLTGIVHETSKRDKTWVKVYSGPTQVWPAP